MINGSMLDAMNIKNSSIHIMSRDHRCYFVNDFWRHIHNLNKKTSLVEGLPYDAIPHKAFYCCSDQFKAHDETVFCSGARITSLEIHEYDCIGGWLTFLLNTQPIVDNGRISGLIGEATLLPNYLATFYNDLVHQIILPTGKNTGSKLLLKKPDELCEGEFNTVYLLMLGLKPKQIADHRNVSINTVYTVLNHIRFKLKLDSNQQLAEYAMTHGWYNCSHSL